MIHGTVQTNLSAALSDRPAVRQSVNLSACRFFRPSVRPASQPANTPARLPHVQHEYTIAAQPTALGRQSRIVVVALHCIAPHFIELHFGNRYISGPAEDVQMDRFWIDGWVMDRTNRQARGQPTSVQNNLVLTYNLRSSVQPNGCQKSRVCFVRITMVIIGKSIRCN